MTISKYFFLFLLVLLDLSTCTSCHDEEVWTTLPPETQKGAKTFACMIDDDLFIGGYFPPWMHPALSASYSRLRDCVEIYVHGKINEQAAGSIHMEIDSPQENITQKLSSAYYIPGSTNYSTKSPTGIICGSFEAMNDGMCVITKIDTIQKIVSGRFEFIGKCTFNSTVTKRLMQGRFDLKLDIINE